MSTPFTPITAPLSNNEWAEPIAPWRVGARPEGWGQTDASVDLTLFRVIQDGPDAPRIMRSIPAHMTVAEARELIAALTAATAHLETGVTP